MQLRICRENCVFLLHRGVDESRAMMVPVFALLIDADTFRENQLQPLLANALAEVHQLTRIAGIGRRKLGHAAKVLVISILAPWLDNRFVGQVANVF